MLFFLLACTGSPDTPDDPADTAETGAPDCAYLPPGDRLVLAEACVDGLCAPFDYPTTRAAWGEPDDCAAVGSVATCAWGGVSVEFMDCDHDGAPDETYLCDTFSQDVSVGGDFDGATAEGLGLGVDAACWEEALGAPGALGWEYGANPWVTVTVSPEAGAVTRVTMAWRWDE
ncbi:MAG: hypothetical protein ACK4YP_25880 [Myxococcota bacterium]